MLLARCETVAENAEANFAGKEERYYLTNTEADAALNDPFVE